MPNIRRANIEEHTGWMIVDLEGSEENIARCLSWLAGAGVKVDRIDEGA